MTDQTQDDTLSAEVADIFSLPSASDAPAPAAPAPEAPQAPAAPTAPEAAAAVVAPSAAAAAPEPVSPAPSPAAPPAPLPPLEQTPASGTTPAAPAAAPAVDEQALQIRSLQATIEALQAKINAPAATPAAGTTPAPAGNDQDAPEVVPYGLTVPNEVAAAIFGEDAAQAHNGLNHLMSSLASAIHTRVLHQVRGEQREALAGLARQQEQTAATTSAADMQEQFFGKFPTFKAAVYQPILAQVNSELAASLPNHPWDDNYMTALGARMQQRLAEIAGGVVPPVATAVPVAPTLAPAARPAAMVPTTPRQASHSIPAFEQEAADQIVDIFTAT